MTVLVAFNQYWANAGQMRNGILPQSAGAMRRESSRFDKTLLETRKRIVPILGTSGEMMGADHDQTLQSTVLRRERRTILFVDVVRSVQLIDSGGEKVIARWLAMADAIRDELCPNVEGRVVKSTGDGVLLEFPDARRASCVGLAILALCKELEADIPSESRIQLRLAASTCDILRASDDVYGHGVNIAARLMKIARPNEFLVSAETRDELTDYIDADVEDLGECFLRHVADPVRAYRIGPPSRERLPAPPADRSLRLKIAIMPPTSWKSDPGGDMIGELIAEELIGVLAINVPEFAVVSRLSTSGISNRGLTAGEIGRQLSADFIVAGTYRTIRNRVELTLELTRAASEEVIDTLSESLKVEVFFDRDREAARGLVGRICGSILRSEIRRARNAPLATLQSYTLLLAAVALYHRLSRRDFEFAETLLATLIERSPGEALPLAWLGSWHVMRVQQGWSDNLQRDRGLSADLIERALDIDPECVQALIASGSVACNLRKRLDLAEQAYDDALAINPSEPRAWLLSAALAAFRSDGDEAVRCAEKAISLSPTDPHRFLFDSLAASAFLTAGRDRQALDCAERSMRANRRHASTLRVKAVAEWRLGLEQRARATVRELLAIEPRLTIDRYIEASPAPDSRMVREVASTLGRAGLPK